MPCGLSLCGLERPRSELNFGFEAPLQSDDQMPLSHDYRGELLVYADEVAVNATDVRATECCSDGHPMPDKRHTNPT